MFKKVFFICILLLTPVHSRPSSGRGGFGMGSAKSRSLFKTALAGAALGTIGGLAAFQSGNIVISSPSTPFHHHNKNYYWGQEYYQQKHDEISCSITLNDLIHPTGETTAPDSGASDGTHVFSPNQLLSQLQFENGTRPKEIIWSCKQETEICCGTDCCAAPIQNNNNPKNGTFFA